jgi:uncharacterized protein YjdB
VSEGIAGQATLAVMPPPPTPIATVIVAVTPSAIVIGQTAHATATLEDSAGNPLSGRTVTWESSNLGVATVAATGDVKAVGPGTAMIKASSEGKAASTALDVSAPAPIPVASVSVSPGTSTLQIGGTVQLSAVTRDANNAILTGRVISWSSANSGIAKVSGAGLVTASAAGSVVVSASSEGQSGSSTITVSAPAPIPVATVSVSPASSTLQIGGTVQLAAVTRDANNNVLTGRTVTWSSSNSNVSSVSQSGLVTALAAGNATITALSETKIATSAITVSAPAPVPVGSVTVSPASTSVQLGSTAQLSAVTRDASGNLLTGRVIAWSSGNTNKATVNSNNGLVTPVDTGAVQITATSEGKAGSSTVTVQAAPPPPPPPPPGSSNEPTGMTLLKERPFNSVNEDPSWDTDNSLSIVQDATAPKSPSSVLRVSYQTGFAGGSAPGHAGVPHAAHGVLYISFWGKLSSNFWGHLTSVNKQLYEWANGSEVFYFEAAGVGSGTLTPKVVLQSTQSDGVYGPNLVSNAQIPRGQWYHVEIVLNGNSSGASDGAVDWWLDGVHVGSKTGLRFTSGATAWEIFSFTPVWGGIGDSVPSTMNFDIDHVYVSGKN